MLHFSQFGRKVEYGKVVIDRLAVFNASEMAGDETAQLRAAQAQNVLCICGAVGVVAAV